MSNPGHDEHPFQSTPWKLSSLGAGLRSRERARGETDGPGEYKTQEDTRVEGGRKRRAAGREGYLEEGKERWMPVS